MNSVGKYLKKIRDERNLSLKDVNKKTGISDSALSHIESGKTVCPAPERLKKLAVAYQIDLIDLYLKAGYLDGDDLSDYQRCFFGADSLSEEEHRTIQSVVDIIIKKSERCPQ